MSTLNSFAICIIVVIYPSLTFAVPSPRPQDDGVVKQVAESIGELLTGPEPDSNRVTTDRSITTSEPAQPACPTTTESPGILEILLQSFLSESDLFSRKKKLRDDYQYTPNIGIHKFHTRAVPWNVARRICTEEGGHLAVINSRDEARILKEMFNRSGNIKGARNDHEAHIGIHDYFEEGDWVTVLDEPLSATGFTKWSDRWGGQPDNSGTQNCGALVDDGDLDDVPCDTLLPFFCEIPTEKNV